MTRYHIRHLLCNLISAVVIIFLAAAPPALAQESKDKKDIVALRTGAENGNVQDQSDLGFRYSSGDGISKNVPEAVKWWRKAADQGDTDSQYMLGATYYDGDEGIPKDYAEALKWNKKAAAQGESGSLRMLGDAYFEGCGVPKDNVKAHAWYSLALAAGNKYAGKTIIFLEEEMTQVQIAESQRQAKEWQTVINTQKKADGAIQNTGDPDVPDMTARTASSGRKPTKTSEDNNQGEQAAPQQAKQHERNGAPKDLPPPHSKDFMSAEEIRHNMVSLQGKIVKIQFSAANLKQLDDGSYWCNVADAGVTIPKDLGEKWFAKKPYKYPEVMYVLVGSGEMINEFGKVSKGVILTPVGRAIKERGLGSAYEYIW